MPRLPPPIGHHLNTLDRLQSQLQRLGLLATPGVLVSVNTKEAQLHTAKKRIWTFLKQTQL